MDPGKASQMRQDARERADRDVRFARKRMSRPERKDYDRMLEQLNEDSGLYKSNCDKERGIIGESGVPMPTIRGRALAAVKAELVAQLDAERQAVVTQLRAECKALADLLAESRRGLRAMMRPETPDQPFPESKRLHREASGSDSTRTPG
ncbi:MAG: hypothetical protein WKF44_09385 [Rubrobacteraceae bacterium]